MKKIIEETLFEYQKRKAKIDSPDEWENEISDDEEEVVDIEIDTSDMENTEEIEVEENPFEDELIAALTIELKIPEYNRASLAFSIRGKDDEIIHGVPMAKLSNGAFLFKLADGSMKKFYIRDLIVEQKKTRKKKKLNEILHEEDDDMFMSSWSDNEDSEFNEDPPHYLLTDGRKVKMVEATMVGAAGEPILFYYFLDEKDNQLFFKDIKKYLEDDDYVEIKDITDSAAEQNKENEYEG